MSKKGDLFGFLDNMNRGNFRYVDQIDDEEVKSLSPFVLLMWEGQKDTEIRTVITNQYCNDMVFNLSKHPRLLLKLFVAAGDGMGDCRWKFVKSVSVEESALYKLIAKAYNCGYNEAKDIRKLLSDTDIKEMKEMYSYD